MHRQMGNCEKIDKFAQSKILFFVPSRPLLRTSTLHHLEEVQDRSRNVLGLEPLKYQCDKNSALLCLFNPVLCWFKSLAGFSFRWYTTSKKKKKEKTHTPPFLILITFSFSHCHMLFFCNFLHFNMLLSARSATRKWDYANVRGSIWLIKG